MRFVSKNRKNIKIISRAHGFDIFEDQNKFSVIPFRRFELKISDKVISVSKCGEQYLRTKYPAFTGKFTTSYLGTLESGKNPFSSNENFSIVTCSIIRGIKRLHLMPEILHNINIDLTWHVLGDGPDLLTLKDHVKNFRSNIKVIFHGRLSEKEIYEFYKSTPVNLFVSLSSSEGLPVSMMEAQSFGIPIISTDVGGCNEICNKETGILIPKDFDPVDTANKIIEFRNSDRNSEEFRRRCKDHWEKSFNAKTNYTKFAEKFLEN